MEDDGPAGDVLVTLGNSEFESSLGGARMVDGVLSGEVEIGMGGVVRYRLAYRGDALVGVAELLMGRLVAVSSVRLEREGGTAVAAPFPDDEGLDPSWYPIPILTDHPAEDNGPRVSPDGRRIVFFSNGDGNFEIYVMNRDGTEPSRLTRDEGGDVYPTWSPDGAWIAFESDRTGTPEIHRMRPDGSELCILTGPGAAEHAGRGATRR